MIMICGNVSINVMDEYKMGEGCNIKKCAVWSK